MSDKSFKDYILSAKKQFSYRLKFAFPLSESNVATIERVSQKYGVVDFEKPVRLMIQKNPLDFANVENSEVYVIDIVTDYPASTELYHQELRQALGVAEKLVVVRIKNDPYELETNRINSIKDEQEDGTYKTRLLSPHYEESADTDVAAEYYGDKYNEKMKDVISDYRKDERKRLTKTVADRTSPAENYNDSLTKKSSKGPFTDIERYNGSIVK